MTTEPKVTYLVAYGLAGIPPEYEFFVDLVVAAARAREMADEIDPDGSDTADWVDVVEINLDTFETHRLYAFEIEEILAAR